MRDTTRGIEVSVTILLALAGAAVGMGVFRASDHHDAAAWWAAAAVLFLLSVLVAVAFFVLHPLFVRHRQRVQPTAVEAGDGEPAGPDLLAPSELRTYLRSIKQTMNEEGFGSSPAAKPSRESALRSVAQPDPHVVRENHARVVRANVQLVIDELAWARRIINEALEDEGSFWDRDITWDKWDNVKSGLAGESGFHAAYNATREAWDALQRAELDRVNNDPGIWRGEFAPWQQRHVERALETSEEAERLLVQFLANTDFPG